MLFEEYQQGLEQLEQFDYCWCVSMMHLNSGFRKTIRPQARQVSSKSDVALPKSVGLFASRAPHRPNPIAMSALRITSVDVEAGVIHVLGLDLLNDTPILDIKPYCPAFDAFPEANSGWMDAIYSDHLDGREHGYQSITSGKGRRSARKSKT